MLAAVGVILSAKILYLRIAHPLRLKWCWHGPTVGRLMIVGLPILANTAAFGAVLALDRVLLLGLVPDGARAAGLYTVALMGTGWSLDVSGRVVAVLYTHFQTTLGRSGEVAEVARAAIRATEAQAPILAAGGAIAYVFAPSFLGMLMPRYVEGVAAIRPLMPGMVLLGLAWPARQMLIAVGRPYRLFFATIAALAFAAEVGAIGASELGLVGVAWGMSIGYSAVVLLTSASAFATTVGLGAWLSHLAKVSAVIGGFALAAATSAHVPIGLGPWGSNVVRGFVLVSLAGPLLIVCGHRGGWLALVSRWGEIRARIARGTPPERFSGARCTREGPSGTALGRLSP